MLSAVILLITLVSHATCQEDIYIEAILESPNAGSCSATLKNLTSKPHAIGANNENNEETVAFVKAIFEKNFFKASVLPFNIVLNLPDTRVLTLIFPNGTISYNATLKEEPISQDPTSGDPTVIDTWLAYTADGNVTAQLVYVNYGTVQDYQTLARYNITVEGKIVIVRYGQVYRGVKLYEAQLRKAIGVIIYSDPYDDGFRQGDIYPDGPFRPPSGVQRGAAKYDMLCPGNIAADRVRELCNKTVEAVTPTIPAIPISYQDAEPFLRSLKGPPVPVAWQGALGFHYHIGPSEDTVLLHIVGKNGTVNGWNVMGEIEGQEPDKVVIIGNHRDAWTFGAADPSSGTVVLLEIAKALGALTQKGWKPKRTIRLMSWDGEEVGLTGSIDYGETNAVNITQQVVAYINVDVAVSGSQLQVSATPSFTEFIRSSEITGKVKDPKTGNPISEVWDQTVSPLGFGSDYVVFVDRLGIPSFDGSFSGSYGVYHSVYDSYHWMETQGDPGFVYHVAASQLWSLIAFHMADDNLLPYNYVDYHSMLRSFTNSLEAVAGVKLSYVALEDALSKFLFASQTAHERSLQLKQSQDADEIKAHNDMLVATEKLFLSTGLPERPWFKHVLVAPGIHKGYDSDYFPGVLDAIEIDDYKIAQEQLDIVTQKITAAADQLKGDIPYPEPPRNWNTMIALGVLCLVTTVIIMVYFLVRHMRGRSGGARGSNENQRLL